MVSGHHSCVTDRRLWLHGTCLGRCTKLIYIEKCGKKTMLDEILLTTIINIKISHLLMMFVKWKRESACWGWGILSAHPSVQMNVCTNCVDKFFRDAEGDCDHILTCSSQTPTLQYFIICLLLHFHSLHTLHVLRSQWGRDTENLTFVWISVFVDLILCSSQDLRKCFHKSWTSWRLQ